MMFAALPLAAISNPDLGLTDFRILASLASFASPSKPVAWPSRASIGQRAGITSLSLISKTLHRLEDLGLIDIQQTGRTNVYRLLNGPQHAPGEPCRTVCTSDVQDGMHPKQTIYQTTQDPLTPKPEAVTVTPIEQPEPIAVRDPIAIHPDPETVEPSTRAHEEVAKVERAATPQHREATEPHDRAVDPTPQDPTPKAPERPQSRLERIAAAQRLVTQLNRITGLQLPLDASGIAVRRAARALNRYTEAEIIQVILVHALGFNHPASILKGSVLEPLVSEQRKRHCDAQKRAKRDQDALAEIKQQNRTQGDKSVGRAHLDALKAMLGRSKKPLDEVMRA